MASLSAPFSLEIRGLCWRVRSSPCPASQCVPKSHSPLPQNDLAQQSPGRPRAWHLLGAGFSPQELCFTPSWATLPLGSLHFLSGYVQGL